MDSQADLPHILLVEPNAPLRSAIRTLLAAERYQVELCDSLEQVRTRTNGRQSAIALVAWQSMDGLLAEDRREHLVELTRGVRLVLMVPRRWSRLLQQTELCHAVAGLVAKPFEADELLGTLQTVILRRACEPKDLSYDSTAEILRRTSSD
jgi:DNA-binding response OmpR family regulator